MADREASFVIAFEGKGAGLQTFLNAMKGSVREAVRDMQSAGDALTLFRNAKSDASNAAAAFEQTRKRLEEIRAEVKRVEEAGGTISKGLARGLKEAESAFASHAKALDKANVGLENARTGMRSAEVATVRLAAEQKKLAEEWARQNAAATAAQQAAEKAAASAIRLAQEIRGIDLAFQASKDALGFKTLRDVQPEIEKARLAFQHLASSGRLSFAELGLAQNALNTKIKEIQASVGSLGQAFGAVRNQLLAFTAATAGIVAAGFNAASSFRDFAQQMAAIGSITNVTGTQLEAMGAQVRQLSRDMGVDAVNSAKALYDIIGSGVEDPANALIVLQSAAKAAVAGLTDTNTAARIGVQTMNAFGLQVNDITKIFDVLFKVVQDGVITFPELANNFGEVTAVAVGAGVSIETLGGAFVTLTRNGINAAESATAIRSAIQGIAAPAPEARQRFHELGIELGNFGSVIEQISKKDLSLSQLREIVSDVRALKAVQILTQQFNLFQQSVEAATKSAGAMEGAYAKLAATPQARVDRFRRSLEDLNLTIGEFVTRGTPAIEFLTGLVNGFNNLTPATRSLIVEVAALTVGLTAAYALFRLLSGPINLVVGALSGLGAAAAAGGAALTAATVALGALKLGFAALLGFKFGEQLYEQFAPVRLIGDLLGNVIGRIENALGFAQARIQAFFTGNTAAAQRATETYQRNAEILNGQWADAVSGAAEKSRALTEEQLRQGEAFARTRDAIIASTTAAQSALGALQSSVKSQIDATEQALTATRARLGQIVDVLREQLGLVQQNAKDGIASLGASTKAQIEALGTLQLHELARIQQTTEIQKQAADERLKLLVKFGADSQKAFEAEASVRLAVASKSKEDIERVERSLTEARKGVLTEVVNAFRSHVSELLQVETSHVERVRQIQEQRRGINESVEAQIREFRRGTLSEYEAYSDRVRQVDEQLSKARQALAVGDQQLAQRYAEQAIRLSGQIAQKVTESGRVVVDEYEASRKAISRVQEAQDILNKSLKEEESAARAGAGAAAGAHEAALLKLREYEAKLSEVTAKAAAGVDLEIRLKTEAVEAELLKLEGLVAQRELLAPLRLVLTAAVQQLDALKAELANNGIPVNIVAKLEGITAAIDAVREAKPELTVQTTAATAAVTSIADKVKALADLRPQLTIDSNVDAVQSQIDNLKRPTSSEHTVFVKRVEVNAAGGPVGEGVQAFARGGGVFRKPAWDKVPGEGNRDTVPAALQEGSFVIRKSASKYYGNRIMSMLAMGKMPIRKFATGGKVKTRWDDVPRNVATSDAPAVPTTPRSGPRDTSNDAGFFGDVKAGTRESQRDFDADVFDQPELPKDPRALERKVLEYANAVVVAARQIDGSQFWAPALRAIAIDQKDYEQRPTAEKLATLLRRARGIGLNLGITTGTRQGFDVDGRRFHKRIGKAPAGLANARLYAYEFYQRGGAAKGGDTVPAMLTPGEWVIRREAVQKFGSGLMHALNSMSIPKHAFAGMAAPPVRHYAAGGPVGVGDVGQRLLNPDSALSRRLLPGAGGVGDNIFNLNATASDIFTIENIRRFFVPVWDEIQRRKR